MVSGGVGSYARFSVMHGTVAGPVAESQRGTLEAVHEAYDMNAHFTHGSPQSKALTDEVIDAFAIAGPPSYCLERFAELAEMGLAPVLHHGPGPRRRRGRRRGVAPPLRRARSSRTSSPEPRFRPSGLGPIGPVPKDGSGLRRAARLGAGPRRRRSRRRGRA